MTNHLEKGAELPDIEDVIESSKGKMTRLELPKILFYDEIDRFLFLNRMRKKMDEQAVRNAVKKAA